MDWKASYIEFAVSLDLDSIIVYTNMLLVATAKDAVSVVPRLTSCPSTYTVGPYGCLKRFSGSTRWACRARRDCLEEGADLPSPRSQEAFRKFKIQLHSMTGERTII